MPRTGFDPRAHGFHFANDFVDKVVTVPGYGEVATDGRSGGMAFAALDYWFAGLPVPSHRPDDFPDRAVPEDGTRLADFIHKRLFDSYATWSARQFLTWTLAEDHPTWSSPGVARWTSEELPRLRRSIDAGRPVVLGLVGARALEEVGRNRQVVAYGYGDDGAGPGGGPPIRLFVYDGHHPDTEVVLALEAGALHRGCHDGGAQVGRRHVLEALSVRAHCRPCGRRDHYIRQRSLLGWRPRKGTGRWPRSRQRAAEEQPPGEAQPEGAEPRWSSAAWT